MELNLGNKTYDILQDWHPNKAKKEVTDLLVKQVLLEKQQLPKLLSREDLKERWEMNSRQSVHQVATKPDFPAPILTFNHGKTLLYLETEIQIFEVNHPWLITASARLDYSHWILKNVISD